MRAIVEVLLQTVFSHWIDKLISKVIRSLTVVGSIMALLKIILHQNLRDWI